MTRRAWAVRAARDVRLGVKNLLLHKLRSLLTTLGLVFGVGSVIAMLAIGEGASAEAIAQIRRLGSRNVLLRAVKPAADQNANSGHARLSVYGLLYEDAARIGETIPGVVRAVPAKQFEQTGRLRGRELEMRIVGTTADWFDLVRRPLVAGRVLTEADEAARAHVAVLTEWGARRLLATEHALGETLTLGGNAYEVVGVVRSEEGDGRGMQAPDARTDAYVPLSTARERHGDVFAKRTQGANVREQVQLHQILVETADEALVEPAARAIERALETFHKKKDYEVAVPLALLRQAQATRRTFSIVLGAIAGISLLVGGIGIMNIMLATVTERTREIGIRRAIGARRSQIVAQFLVEALVLSAAGGAIGIGVGLAIPRLVTLFSGMPTVVRAWSLLLAFGISVGTGVAFGLYPAVRASRLDPIEALRHE
ncbi:MAG: ABC transporter permease [Kiritimatiellae bacterium]|nr:ABC transporter permease [Kiritimatiellia bacterium]